MRLILTSLLLLWPLVANAQRRTLPGAQCTFNGDCAGALICDVNCRLQCRGLPGTERDCARGQVCIVREPNMWNTCAPVNARKQVSWHHVPAHGRVTQIAVVHERLVYAVIHPLPGETKAAPVAPKRQSPKGGPSPEKPRGPAPGAELAVEPRTMRWNGAQWDIVAPAMPVIVASPSHARLWALDAHGTVHRLDNGRWVSVGGTLDDLSVDPYGFPVGTRNGAMWGYDGARWHAVAQPSVRALSFCSTWGVRRDGDETCWWGLTAKGEVFWLQFMNAMRERKVYATSGLYVSQEQTNGPQPISIRPGDNVKRIAAVDWNNAWAVTTANEIYQWSYGGWDKQPGNAIDIATGWDRSVWAIGPTGMLFQGR